MHTKKHHCARFKVLYYLSHTKSHLCWVQKRSSPVTRIQTYLNEWMLHLYIALFCVLPYTQSALQSCKGVSPQPPVCSIHLDDVTAATGQRRQCALHTPDTGGERERDRQSSGWGLLGGHDWQGPVEGIWPGHPGIFNDHRVRTSV